MTPRTLAVSSDDVLGHQLAAALVGTGLEVTVCPEVPAASEATALWLLHLDADRALPAVPGTAPIIVVATAPGLSRVVDVMQASDRVVGVIDVAALDGGELAALASRVVGTREPFGLAARLAPGTQIHTLAVADHDDKQRCIAQVRAFAAQTGMPEIQGEAIEQCLDELLMNALYDAPADARGRPLFEGMDVRGRITRRTDRSVTVEYATDRGRLAVAVRDEFGRLGRGTLLRHLHKGLHARDKVDRKAGGSGLGLFLTATSASSLSLTVRSGAASEATCTFHVAGRTAGCDVDFVELAADGAPRAARVRRTSAALRVVLRRAAAIAAAAAVVVGVLLAVPLPGAHRVKRVVPVATLELDSQPTDAEIAIDGKPVGSTPLAVTSLAPGAQVTVTFDKPGYRRATAALQVPKRGEVVRHAQLLERSAALVRVRLVSTPPGADVRREGAARTVDRTYTPADVFVEPDRPQRFTLAMRSHVPVSVDVVAKRGADGVVVAGELVEGRTIRFEAASPGKVSAAGAPHCQRITVPGECTLAPGRYVVTFAGTGPDVSRTIDVVEDAVERL